MLFLYLRCNFKSYPVTLPSVVTESGMAKEVKIVNDSILVQKGKRNADLSNKS